MERKGIVRRRAAYGFALLAGCALFGACVGDKEVTGVKDGVRIVSGAWPDGEGTRVTYETDGDRHRVVWTEGDALRVAAFADGVRVSDGGKRWSRFDMVTDDGFDASYMLFSGPALMPSGSGKQRLYALSPAGMLAGETEDKLVFPSVQTYSPDSFDPDAVLLVSAPVEAELPQSGTVHTAPFRFAHYTGYLCLAPEGLPESVSEERIDRIVLERMDGEAVSGNFEAVIDDAAGDWTLEPGGETLPTVTLDFAGSGTTVGDVESCWFSLLPGTYGRVAVSIYTVSGTMLRMERDGLVIEPGVIGRQRIRFGAGDTVTRTFRLDGGDLGIGETMNGEKMTGTKDGIVFGYYKLKCVSSGGELHVEFGKNGSLANESPFPGRITSVEVECTEAVKSRFIKVSMGTAAGEYAYTRQGTTNEVNCFEAPAGSDYRYMSVENGNTYVADLRNIRITCVQED